MNKFACFVFSYSLFLSGFSQSWDLQQYNFSGLFETDSALFCVTSDKWGISYDHGETWTLNSLNIEESFGPRWIAFFTRSYGLIGLRNGNDNYVLKTVDGGKSWSRDDDLFSPQYWSIGCYHVSEGTFIIKAVQGSTLDITYDYGEFWEKVSFQNSGYTYAPELHAFGNIVYLRTGRRIYKSVDGGRTWETVFSRSSDEMITFNFLNMDVGYLLVGNCCDESKHVLYKTIDGGLNWSSVETNLSGIVSALIFISESKGFVVDNESGWIKESTSNGESWIKNTPFELEPYQSLRTSHSAYIFGRDAFKFYPEGEALGLLKKRIIIYPNPSNSFINLDFAYIEYKIVDLSGRLVMSGN